ncbi:MAG: NADPH dehydrogenase NamA [Flavobacteriales bacterium]|nr:MAG: NADPH dehydrogenase NamA [Flavobacteriales bacterium]
MLYTPIQFRNIELANRWVMSPMCLFSAEKGVPNDFHFVHYTSRAMGGIGLIMIESTGIEPIGRITNQCTGIWNDEQIRGFKKINDFIHQNTASKTGIQLGHAGRKSLTDGKIIAPSPIPYQKDDKVPHELSIKEIKERINLFVQATKKAIEAGFDIIEIHSAHGYLVHQFLSPISNTRTDEYGGSFENRIRFLVEIVEKVNEVLDENHPLFVRISGTEYADELNGWNLEDSIRLAKALKEKKVDLIDVSTGGNYDKAKISLFDHYQVPFASAIKKEAKIKTGAVGLIKTPQQANEILQNKDADLIFIGRALLRNPYLALQGAIEMNEKCTYPKQYKKAFSSI